MGKKGTSKKGLDIWNDVLLINVQSDLLKSAPTVPQRDKPYAVQIFEVLVAESLNLRDRHTRWNVTEANHDGGVDLIGTDEELCRTPFTTTQYRLLSVGQVKRRSDSYRYDDLRTDIYKARGYWVNSDRFRDSSPKQFVFVLSTDGKNGVKVLQEHLENDLTSNTDIQFKNGQFTHIQLIDAANIIKSWRFNLSYYEKILEDALSPEQLACFREYVSELDRSWLTATLRGPESGGVGEPLTYSLLITTPAEDVEVLLYARWIPLVAAEAQLLHPLRMVDPRGLGLPIRVKGQAEIQFTLRGMCAGQHNFGKVELFTEDRTWTDAIPLQPVDIYEGFCSAYFASPQQSVLQGLKKQVLCEEQGLVPVSIVGCGGIGKSSLISEVMVTAAQTGYYLCDVTQPKDLLHPRVLLYRLFSELMRPDIPQNTLLKDLPLQIKIYLGSSYLAVWERDIEAFFRSTDGQFNVQSIAQCLVVLLLSVAKGGRVFLWLSNLHWAAKETLDILRMALDLLHENQELLEGRIVWVFEGRSGEVLSYDEQAYYPVHWEKFLSNSVLQPYSLPMWSPEDSDRFLRQLFVETVGNNPLYNAYFKKMLEYGGGVPMQMLELVRSDLEQGILRVEPTQEYRLRIDRLPPNEVEEPVSILDTIHRRIHFYRQKCGDLIDFCVVLAALDDSIPPLLAERLIRDLHTRHSTIDALIFRSGFLTQRGQEYHFCHEHYQVAFRQQQLTNKAILSKCLNYYGKIRIKTIQDRYAEIKLHLLADDCDLAQQRQSIIALLGQDVPKRIEQSLYKLLLQISHGDESGISRCEALFQLCESYLREGSWKAGQDYLEQLLELPRTGDVEELALHLKAYQELSNILCDRLLFEAAIHQAEDGLELAELALRNRELTKKQRDDLCVLQEKLLARLAVCHWFAGDPAQGITLQRQCYERTVERRDTYSAGHVLYEIGTLVFHFDVEAGVAIMENVLAQCKDIPSLERHERTLIETQLLMGKLVWAARKNDSDQLGQVRLECRRLLEIGRASPHSYERFLCLTMRGICTFLVDNDAKKAQDFFLESLRCAKESDMPNLEWKALFHIAQMCALDKDPQWTVYTKEAKLQVEKAIEENPRLQGKLRHMFLPILTQLERLEACEDLSRSIPDTGTMISVSGGGCLFIIMN